MQEIGEWLERNKPESPPATIVHGDYRLGNTMFASDPPSRLIAIFDWEMATIGDPLADLGYMTATWSEPNESQRKETTFDRLTVTHAQGFMKRDELVMRYEEKTGRSMSDLRWYQALALWKAAVFMEGNYKRSLAGASDDPYLKLFDVGVPQLAEGILPAGVPGYDPSFKGLPYDPAHAKQLLAEAGYPNGSGFPPLTLSFRASFADIACASTVQNVAPGRRQAQMRATDPMPDPRSAARETRGAHWVAYHAVRTSSVARRTVSCAAACVARFGPSAPPSTQGTRRR